MLAASRSGHKFRRRRQVYNDPAAAVGSVKPAQAHGVYFLTPYDSPAMWNARPLNLVKCSKKIATNAATSLAASPVVLYGIDGKKRTATFHVKENKDILHIHHTLRTRTQRQLVDQ